MLPFMLFVGIILYPMKMGLFMLCLLKLHVQDFNQTHTYHQNHHQNGQAQLAEVLWTCQQHSD